MFRRFLKKQTKSISKWAIFSLFFGCFVLVISFGINIVKAVWHEPTATPAGDNIFGYINIGPDNQAKRGKLRLGSSDLTNFTYSLEVKGEAEMNELIVNGQGKFGETLYINPQVGQLGRVGIGTPAPTTTLEVSGGGVTVGNATIPISDKAIEGYSSGDTAIYGEATGIGTDYYGVRGINDSYYGVWGVSDSGRGVYGKSTDASGVMGVTYSEKYGIYGCNGWDSESGYCLPNLLAWAGYFSGRVIADNNDVIGTRFLPEKLQASLVPFTQGQVMSTKSNFEMGDPHDIAFDDDNFWVVRYGYQDAGGVVYKIRPSDGARIADINVQQHGPTRIIYDGGDYLWVTNWDSHSVSKINKNTDTVSGPYSTVKTGVNCPPPYNTENETTYDDYEGCGPIDLVFDGTYIWTSNYSHYDNRLGTSSISKIRASDGARIATYLLPADAVYPESITFDGTNIWTANTNSNNISKFDIATETFTTYNTLDSGTEPVDIIYDGVANLWTANHSQGEFSTVSKINLDGSVADTYQTGAWGGVSRVMVDNITTGGPYIWASNVSSLTKFDFAGNRILMGNGTFMTDPTGVYISGLAMDKPYQLGGNNYTYIWTTDFSSNQLSKIKSSNGVIVDHFLPGGTIRTNFAFDSTYIWTANSYSRSISKIRAADGQKMGDYFLIKDPTELYNRPAQLVYDGQYIWVTHFTYSATYISKIRASDGHVEILYDLLSNTKSPVDIVLDNNTAGGPYLWILLAGYSAGEESRLIGYRISENKVVFNQALGMNIPANSQKPKAMAFDGKNLWIANYYDENNRTSANDASSILKVQLDPLAVSAPINLTGTYKPSDILFDGKYLWTVNSGNIISGVSDGSVSKWLINSDGGVTQVAGSPFAVNTNGEQPLYLTFDGTDIWVAANRRESGDANNYITRLRASDGQDKKFYYLANYQEVKAIAFDGSSVWVASTNGGLFKFYTGAGYGQQNIEQVVRLQNIVPGYTDGEGSDFKHFNISGDGTVGDDAPDQVSVGGNVSVANNLWGGSSDSEVPISGAGTYDCPDGYFVKDIQQGNLFGNGGVITETGIGNVLEAIAKDSEYMYLAGVDFSSLPNQSWRLEKRRLSDGSLDNNFGTGGVVTSAGGNSAASDIATDSTYMYVVGADVNGEDWRLEKRRLSDGALCTAANCGTEFGTNGVINGDPASWQASSIAVDSNYMYVIGINGDELNSDWRLEKRRLSDGALCTAANCVTQFGNNGVIIVGAIAGSVPTDLSIDSQYMYIVGTNGPSDNSDWRLEKRRLSDGALCTAANCGTEFGSGGVIIEDTANMYAFSIAIDSNYMYVGGEGDNFFYWRLEKRRLSDGALCTAANCGTEFGSGGVLTLASFDQIAYDMAIDSNYMYLTGNFSVMPRYYWHIEKRRLSDGALCTAANCGTEFGSGGVINVITDGDSLAQAITIDSTYMYVGGGGASATDEYWRIEKRRLSNGSLADYVVNKILCRPL